MDLTPQQRRPPGGKHAFFFWSSALVTGGIAAVFCILPVFISGSKGPFGCCLIPGGIGLGLVAFLATIATAWYWWEAGGGKVLSKKLVDS